jgi:hypothetical protein
VAESMNDDLDDVGESADELRRVIAEGTFSAGETGEAVDVDGAARDAGLAEVIIGEIPDPHNLSHMLWTARCTVPSHGLLGTFENREEAENAKRAHLLRDHGSRLLD